MFQPSCLQISLGLVIQCVLHILGEKESLGEDTASGGSVSLEGESHGPDHGDRSVQSRGWNLVHRDHADHPDGRQNPEDPDHDHLDPYNRRVEKTHRGRNNHRGRTGPGMHPVCDGLEEGLRGRENDDFSQSTGPGP